ncbi:hypothetical protein D3C72_1147260 [compost metagenome]
MVAMAPALKVGSPNANGVTSVNQGARATSSKLPMPSSHAATPPISRPISTARLRTSLPPWLFTNRISATVPNATTKNIGEPKSLAPCPPPAHW